MSPEMRQAQHQKLLFFFYPSLGGHSKPWNKLPQDTVNCICGEFKTKMDHMILRGAFQPQ